MFVFSHQNAREDHDAKVANKALKNVTKLKCLEQQQEIKIKFKAALRGD
jgi:hypothetical protein